MIVHMLEGKTIFLSQMKWIQIKILDKITEFLNDKTVNKIKIINKMKFDFINIQTLFWMKFILKWIEFLFLKVSGYWDYCAGSGISSQEYQYWFNPRSW